MLMCSRFGLSFIGPAWSETKLIGFAYDFEQRTKLRDTIQPYIKPKTEIRDAQQGRHDETGSTRREEGLESDSQLEV